MVTWDRERVHKIVNEMLDNPDRSGVYATTECYDQLEKLMIDVRRTAIEWTWQQACQQYTQGRDPQLTPIRELFEKAAADLNPDRNRG